MGREVFIDAGAWIAVTSQRDQYHALAVETYGRLLRDRRLLVTTNLVVAEAYSGIRRYSPQSVGARFLASLKGSTGIIKVYSDEHLEAEAEMTLRKYADHDLSLTDAVSFAVMRERQISEVFTFDGHFRAAGFVQLN